MRKKSRRRWSRSKGRRGRERSVEGEEGGMRG